MSNDAIAEYAERADISNAYGRLSKANVYCTVEGSVQDLRFHGSAAHTLLGETRVSLEQFLDSFSSLGFPRNMSFEDFRKADPELSNLILHSLSKCARHRLN